MYASYAVGGVSDGTFTQDPRVYRPPLAPPPPSSSIAIQQLLCDEIEGRMRLACDALTDFQRVVGLCVSERFGRWTFTLAPSMHSGSGWCCPRCGYSQQDAESDGTALQSKVHSKTAAAKVRDLFAHGSCRTPLCSADELRRTSDRCQYAADASALLEKRYMFQQEFGSLLQRISAASRGIQDSVTR
ncbi:hypothetical protein ABB37_05063 [Leptomonas pyrrhocoris]|uniref:Uncharacterized protein n=1 Tax=Leptomonas pyrrhocoris TaxID=157538 RepID=A0A0M9G145_LEPPY|nr:hypothetical protein ABB37_05063 [Leptomonas pyrrhocoris]KPA80046.1 hypothetical protein ABB37_05063 [Leptomonas pyrrhocoris]|eukprot:XP_015658485.1 hypothetical protein ABB37_05063 [Leptomonas pyrrhocoris]